MYFYFIKTLFSILFLSVVFLTSCSDNPDSFFRSPSAIVDKLKSLEGKNIDTAISMMGLPQSEQMIAGRKIYAWSDGGSVTSLQTQSLVNPSTGKFEDWVYANKNEFSCVVRALVNVDEIITLIEVKANSVYYCPGQ